MDKRKCQNTATTTTSRAKQHRNAWLHANDSWAIHLLAEQPNSNTAATGATPAQAGYAPLPRQFAAMNDETFSLKGWINPGQIGEHTSLAELRAMGDRGKTFTTTLRQREVFCQHVIERLEET